MVYLFTFIITYSCMLGVSTISKFRTSSSNIVLGMILYSPQWIQYLKLQLMYKNGKFEKIFIFVKFILGLPLIGLYGLLNFILPMKIERIPFLNKI